MKKLSVFCFVSAIFLYISPAYSRICFLADTDCQNGEFDVDKTYSCLEQNSNYVHEYDICSGLEYGSFVCNDSTGNYYNNNPACPSGYTNMYSLDDSYICTGSTFGEGCGLSCCLGTTTSGDDIMCSDNYQLCENNSTGSGESCVDSEGTKYKECICSSSTYSTQCNSEGLTPAYSNYCVDSDGEYWYTDCSCASGWTLTTLANIKCNTDDGCCSCTVGAYTKLPGTTDSYCWEGSNCYDYESCKEKCTIAYQSDFDNFWSGYDVNDTCSNLTVDCQTLGYTSGTAGTGVTCTDGTEPYRCPFDHTAVYCESGINGGG